MSLRRIAVSGVKWTAVSNFGRRILSLATNIVLARLLAPTDFGLIAMAAVVLGFLDLFRDLGTGSAVIQRKEVDQDLLSSVFWLNVLFGLLCTGLLILLAPVIGFLYAEERVIPLLQVMAASFALSAVGIVHSSLLTRELRFEALARIEVIAAVAGAASAIALAASGQGVWSLVAQGLVTNLISSLWLWMQSPWRPSLVCRWGELRQILAYSLNLTGSNITNFVSRTADNVLIGRFLGAEALGYYSLAYRLMLYPLEGITAVLTKVMFPLYVQLQDDDARLGRIYLTVAGAVALVTFPLMLGLMAVREPLILTLFGERWSQVIGLLLFFAPLGALQSVSTTVGSIYQAKGRTDILFRWSLFSTTFVVIAFVVGLPWGILGVAACYTAVSVALYYPCFYFAFRLIGLPVRKLWGTLAGPALCATLMAVAVMALGGQLPPELSPLTRLAVLVPAGALVYVGAVFLFNREQALNVVHTLRGR